MRWPAPQPKMSSSRSSQRLLPFPELQSDLAAEDPEFSAVLGLLPRYVVAMREGSVMSQYVPSIVRARLEAAWRAGHTIDRTNGDGPLEEWDGWLRVESPVPLFIRVAGPGGVSLE